MGDNHTFQRSQNTNKKYIYSRVNVTANLKINILISKTINVITTGGKYFKKQTRGECEWSVDVAETSVGGNWNGKETLKYIFIKGTCRLSYVPKRPLKLLL